MNTNKSRILILTSIFISLIIIWIIGFNYHGFFKNKDNMDYAQMGREVKKGNGFSTTQLFPGQLRYLQEKGFLKKKNIPNLYRFPLPILSNTLFQFIVKNPVKANIIQSGFWMLLTIPFIFLIVSKFSGIFPGIIASLFFYLDSFVISYNGMGETLTVFLVVLLFYFVLKEKKDNFFLQGMLLGLITLSRSTFLILLPLFIIFYLAERAKLKKILILFTGFIIIFSGWMIRNITLTGSPLFSLSNIRLIEIPHAEGRIDPFYTLEMDYSTFDLILKNKDHLLDKTGSNMVKFFSIKFWRKNISVSFYFLLLLIIFYFFIKDEFLKKRAALFFLLFLSTFIVYAPFLLTRRYLIPLKPLILIFFVIFSQRILAVLRSKIKVNSILLYSILLVFTFGMITSWDLEYKKITKFISGKRPDKRLHSLDKLGKIVKGKVVLSDISYRIALFCDTRAVRAPIDPTEISEIDAGYLKIDYIVLSKKLPLKMRKNYKRFFREKLYSENFSIVDSFKGIHVLKRREE
ncbi:MAG: hypothetical protein KAS21_01805 [Candidatus Aminicenantes bacterium]|nr:hypothetical protein [Candidatus Aminicenantes bacterium]